MKYFSMFSGIGGFELGIADRGECIGYSEIDKYSIQTYEKNFGKEVKNYGDATKIIPEKLPDFDLLVGGFPCQAFSTAGKRRGFEDTRGTLFFEIARIIKRKQPRMFLLENVKGFLNHDNGETFTTILKTIDELGYDAEWQVLNSKHFGVPQNRERVFIIGHLRGSGGRQIFPIRKSKSKTIQIEIKDTFQKTIYNVEGISPTVREGHGDVIRIMRGRPRYKNGKRILKWYEYKDICPTVTTTVASGDQKNIILPQIRKLTPIECERLQGFPDNWTDGVPDTHRYKQLGNAVTVNVIKKIIALMEHDLK